MDNGNSSSSNRENENTNKICPLARGSVFEKSWFLKKKWIIIVVVVVVIVIEKMKTLIHYIVEDC